MADTEDERWEKKRAVGSYMRSGKWDDYWRQKISHIADGDILIRGYPLTEVIENLSYTEALYLTLRGELPGEKETRVMNALLCGIVDYEFINATTPAARFVASASPDSSIPGIAAGVLAMGSYTVSPQDSAALINSAHELMKRENLTKEETAKRVVKEYRESNNRIPGLGHPVYKEVDPRAVALSKVAKEAGLWGEKSQLYEAIHDEFVKSTGKPVCINIDGMMACVGNEMGFDPLEIAGIAALSFMCGIIAHVVEEIREGVPLRVIPPEMGSTYVGPPERHLSAK